jgi:hypothetical protein
VNFIKRNKRFNFKEFNEEWNRKGNYSYAIQFKDKNRALETEMYLLGMGFEIRFVERSNMWEHHARKNFNLRICPRKKYFYRSAHIVSEPERYNNVYKGHYFDNFCFRFVIIEKKLNKKAV